MIALDDMTAEDKARELLERMGFTGYPWPFTAVDLAELANLIAERDSAVQALERGKAMSLLAVKELTRRLEIAEAKPAPPPAASEPS